MGTIFLYNMFLTIYNKTLNSAILPAPQVIAQEEKIFYSANNPAHKLKVLLDSENCIFDLPKEIKLIDLELPSGTLWCDRNIGAEFPENIGEFFQFGTLEGCTLQEVGSTKNFTIEEYKWYANNEWLKYYDDAEIALELEDDASYSQSNGMYCIPNTPHIKELFEETDCYAVFKDGTGTQGTWDADEGFMWFCDINDDTSMENAMNNQENFIYIKFKSRSNNAELIFPASGLVQDSQYGLSYESLFWLNTCSYGNPLAFYATSSCASVGGAGKGTAPGIPIRGIYYSKAKMTLEKFIPKTLKNIQEI